MPNPLSFRYFKTSPEIIQLAVMLYVRFPLSLRNVEDLLHERGVDVAMNLFGTGGIGLGRNLQAKSRSAGQGECTPVIGNGTWMKSL
jgi:transposase-like protein